MALDFRSGTFQKTYNTLEEISKQGNLTPDVTAEIIRKEGIRPEEFREANKKFKAFKNQPNVKALIERGIDPTEPTLLDAIFLAPTRYISSILGGTAEFVGTAADAGAEAALSDENYFKLKQTIDDVIPEKISETYNAVRDPYHGDGAIATAIELGTDIAALFFTANKAQQLGQVGLKLSKLEPRVVQQLNKLGRKSKLAVKGGALGVSTAVGTTVISDPRQNPVEYLYAAITQDEEALKKLDEFASNPDSPELSDYFNALIQNMALEGLIGAGLLASAPVIGKALASKHLNKIRSGVKTTATKLNSITEPLRKSKLGKKTAMYMTSRRGTDDVTLARAIARDNAVESAHKLATGYADELTELIKRDLSTKIQQNERYISDIINPALNGDEAAKNILRADSPDVANLTEEMRKIIDVEQTALSSYSGTSPELKAIIDDSKGVWLTRSFEFYENPTFRKELQNRIKQRKDMIDVDGNLDVEIIDNAAEFIANKLQKSKNDPYVQDALEELVGTTDKNVFYDMLEDAANKNFMKYNNKVLYKRKNVPIEIRELFGEIKDPAKNFAKSYVKLAQINAENKFQEQMALTLKGKFDEMVQEAMTKDPTLTKDLAENQVRRQSNMVDMSELGSKGLGSIIGGQKIAERAIKSPLQNVYADEAYAKLFEEGLNPRWADDVLKYWTAAKGLSQKVKTVYNPATHGKNVAGNMVMLGANGMLPMGESASKALESVAVSLGKKSNKELGKKLSEYSRLGLTNSNLGLGETKVNLKRIGQDVNDWLDRTTNDKRVVGKVVNGARRTDEWITNLYQAEDDLFKITHFEKTLNYLKDAYPDINEEALKEMAAQRTRDLMPNYNLVPTAIKLLRYAPTGDFVSFPAEMTRISKNLAKYTMQDLVSGNARMAEEGAKRLAGMTIIGAGPSIVMDTSMMVHNIDADEADNIEMAGPVYEVGSDKLFMSDINEDANGHKGVDYFNIGAWDPFNFIKAFGNNTHDLILMGTGMDPQKTNYEFNKTAAALMDQTIGPFLGASMLTEALFDLSNGKDYSNEPTTRGQLQEVSKQIFDIVDPGFYKWWENRKNYEQSGMTDYRSTIDPSSADVDAILGLKKQRADLTAGMYYNFGREFKKIRQSKYQVDEQLKSPNTSKEEIFDNFKDTQRIRLNAFRNIKDMIQLYKGMGFDLEDIANGISMNGEKSDISSQDLEALNAASKNMFVPYMPKETRESYANKEIVPWNEMYQGYQTLYGKGLD